MAPADTPLPPRSWTRTPRHRKRQVLPSVSCNLHLCAAVSHTPHTCPGSKDQTSNSKSFNHPQERSHKSAFSFHRLYPRQGIPAFKSTLQRLLLAKDSVSVSFLLTAPGRSTTFYKLGSEYLKLCSLGAGSRSKINSIKKKNVLVISEEEQDTRGDAGMNGDT